MSPNKMPHRRNVTYTKYHRDKMSQVKMSQDRISQNKMLHEKCHRRKFYRRKCRYTKNENIIRQYCIIPISATSIFPIFLR